MSQQDWMLMHRIAGGDEEAVSELYDRFGALVYKVSRQILPNQAECEDAVQEIFLRLWQTADRYDPRRAKLVTWVMLISRRHLIDRLRRRAARPSIAAVDGEFAMSEFEANESSAPKPDAEQNEALLSRIRELPDLQRQVIERAYLQGYTLREVSEQLEAPLGTVKSALSRGLVKLRERAQADWAM